jgi:nucleoside-diphosphate-sugar epimerase
MIFVTGGSGLVGSHLLKYLSHQGKKVRALYRKEIPFQLPNLEWHQGDILDVSSLALALQGAEEVYHCAGLVTFNLRRKDELIRMNAEGTANMVNAALDASVRKFLHVSSVSALGRHRQDQVVTEASQWEEAYNNSNYGRSKWLAELEVWRGIGEGLQAVIVNPTVVLGMGNWNTGSSALFKNIYHQFPWYSDGVTGFVDADDVAKAMVELMASEITAERFILNAENLNFKQAFAFMAEGFKKKPPHLKVTPFLAGLVWRLEKIKSSVTGHEPLVTKETAQSGLAKVYFSNEKLKKFLPNFQFRPVEESIYHYCREYSEKVNGMGAIKPA